MDQADILLSERLASDVQVVGQPMAGVESAAIGILVGTGARDETPHEFGVSHFTEQMLWRGTEHLDARALSESFDALGVDYDSSAGLEMTLLSAVLLGDRLPEAIDLLTDVIRYPAFPDDSIDQVRSLIVQEIRQREDRPAQKVLDLLRQRYFAGSPLSHDSLGTEETVSSLARADLVRYWSSRFTANNMIISVAGNLDWERILEQLSRITAGWSRGTGRMEVAAPAVHAAREASQRDLAQEHIGFAFPGVPAADELYYAGQLLAQVLGGGVTSRLYRSVREERGLAYAVQARFDGLETCGLYRVYVGTRVERAHESVDVITDDLRRLEDEGITQDELSLAKTRVKSQFVMRSESTSARMMANLRSWWFEGTLHGLEEIKARIDAVSLADVRALIDRLGITENLAAYALGPRSEEELFGRVLTPS
jgi:predicted Zn-dependent peptidase